MAYAAHTHARARLEFNEVDSRSEPMMPTESSEREALVRLWQETTDHYLRYGNTIQTGLFRASDSDRLSQKTSNRFIFERAGLRSGQIVLDAGCGVGGPSLDAAASIPDIEIHGVTISPYQAELAQRLIDESGFGDRIHVQVGDYHDLPFPDGMFDCVLFLESAGYSSRLRRLFAETFRVLRPGGRLYIKDVFSQDRELDTEESAELEEFRQVYLHRMPTMREMTSALDANGFSKLSAVDITPLVAVRPVEWTFGLPGFRLFGNLPFLCGDMTATRTEIHDGSNPLRH